MSATTLRDDQVSATILNLALLERQDSRLVGVRRSFRPRRRLSLSLRPDSQFLGVGRLCRPRRRLRRRNPSLQVLEKPQRRRRDKPAGSDAGPEETVQLDGSAPPMTTCGHTTFTESCNQCWFRRHGKDWQESHGSFFSRVSGGRSVRIVWLQQKPCNMPGPWALGCAVCNAWSKKLEGHPRSTALRRLSQRVSTKWARYEVSKLSQMQASAVQLHAKSQIHLAAVKAFESPDLPLQALLPRSKSDADLLKGAVPQPADWLGAFRAAQSPVSFLKAEKQCQTAAYAAIRSTYTKRRQMKQMISVMTEVTRQKKRAAILNAAHISLAIDDRSPYRVVRFRAACLPSKTQGEESESPSESAPPLVQEGILAVLNGCLPVDSMEQLDDDYSASQHKPSQCVSRFNGVSSLLLSCYFKSKLKPRDSQKYEFFHQDTRFRVNSMFFQRS